MHVSDGSRSEGTWEGVGVGGGERGLQTFEFSWYLSDTNFLQ